MNILIHTQYYPPEIGAPQNRLSELADYLKLFGHNITILTALPNYPTGKLYKGYKNFFQKDLVNGIRTYRAFIYPTKSTNFIKRLLNYFSFVISSFFVGLFLSKNDVIVTESPPLFLGITGFILSRIKKSKWVFNISDLWPASVAELGLIDKNSFQYRISIKMESFLYKKAAIVTGQSETILNNINERYPKINTYLLSNGVDIKKYPVEPKQYTPSIRIIYAGLHGLAQGLDQIITAAREFQREPNIEFVLIGDGPEKANLIKLVKEQDINNIRFLDPITKAEIPNTLSLSDIILVPLKTQLTGAVPSKLYEGMAAGRPIILLAKNEAADIVQKTKCGIVVEPGNINGLISAIRYLISFPEERVRMGKNGREAAVNHYDRCRIASDFEQYLKIFMSQGN